MFLAPPEKYKKLDFSGRRIDFFVLCKVFVETMEFHVGTMFDVLDTVCMVPSRPLRAPLHMPMSGIYFLLGSRCCARRTHVRVHREAR